MAGPAPLPQADPPHAAWAAQVARRVARKYQFRRGSQEEADLIQQAVATVVRHLPRFDTLKLPPGGDPDGLFRGWVYQDVRSECRRLARRLLNGGTYHTRRETPGVLLAVPPLSALETPSGDPVEPAAPDPPPLPPSHPLADLAADLAREAAAVLRAHFAHAPEPVRYAGTLAGHLSVGDRRVPIRVPVEAASDG